jgi:hypothetical protein
MAIARQCQQPRQYRPAERVALAGAGRPLDQHDGRIHRLGDDAPLHGGGYLRGGDFFDQRTELAGERGIESGRGEASALGEADQRVGGGLLAGF